MMPRRRLLKRPIGHSAAHWRLAQLALLALTLSSCGGAPGLPTDLAAPSPVLARSATPATPAVATPVPGIGPIRWTSETDPESSAPVDDVSQYSVDAPELIAASEAVALSAGSVVEARWDYNNTSLDALTTRLQITSDVRQQWLAFTLHRDPDVLWPPGAYRITISLNGADVQQSAVDVVAPE
jgi:hypothetical protein